MCTNLSNFHNKWVCQANWGEFYYLFCIWYFLFLLSYSLQHHVRGHQEYTIFYDMIKSKVGAHTQNIPPSHMSYKKNAILTNAKRAVTQGRPFARRQRVAHSQAKSLQEPSKLNCVLCAWACVSAIYAIGGKQTQQGKGRIYSHAYNVGLAFRSFLEV